MTAPGVAAVHRGAPVAASSASRPRSAVPTKETPPTTAGEPATALPAGADHLWTRPGRLASAIPESGLDPECAAPYPSCGQSHAASATTARAASRTRIGRRGTRCIRGNLQARRTPSCPIRTRPRRDDAEESEVVGILTRWATKRGRSNTVRAVVRRPASGVRSQASGVRRRAVRSASSSAIAAQGSSPKCTVRMPRSRAARMLSALSSTKTVRVGSTPSCSSVST